jgi:hypothetical protein
MCSTKYAIWTCTVANSIIWLQQDINNLGLVFKLLRIYLVYVGIYFEVW